MSTPNTPTSSTPEWLRAEARHRECRGDPQEIPAGLRAAAERIEELEIAEEFGEAALEHLRGENDRLRAENEALRKDRERLDWLEEANVEVAEELIRIGWNPATDAQWEKQTAFLSRLRAFIDAARREAP